MNPALLSSKNMGFQTPDEVLDIIREHWTIELDPCTTPYNPVGASRFICPPDDGLAVEWVTSRGIVFCNPPYGREVGKWVDKAAASADATVIMLVPARTETKWFRRLERNSSAICFWYGRMRFKDPLTGEPAPASAPFPTALALLPGPGDWWQEEIFGRAFSKKGWMHYAD